jgi:hypothetical protein
MNNKRKKMETEKTNIGLFEAIEFSHTWKRYRDSVRSLFLTDKENGEKDYAERMKLLQQVIKAHSEKNKIEFIPSITEITNKEEDARLKVQILAAGYELCDGVDFTIENKNQQH